MLRLRSWTSLPLREKEGESEREGEKRGGREGLMEGREAGTEGRSICTHMYTQINTYAHVNLNLLCDVHGNRFVKSRHTGRNIHKYPHTHTHTHTHTLFASSNSIL